MEISVIIPVYNEKENIEPMVKKSLALEKALRLLRHNGIHDITKIELPCY